MALAVWAAAEALSHQRPIGEAVAAMLERVHQLAQSQPIRVGVGHALRGDLASEITDRLQMTGTDAEIVTYEIGPSVGAHTGPGTVGVVYAPIGLVLANLSTVSIPAD